MTKDKHSDEERKIKLLRLEDVLLNGMSLTKKSKIALKIADSKGRVPDKNGGLNKFRITEILYYSKDYKDSEGISFEKYNLLGCPEYILKRYGGSIIDCPEVLVPEDFPPKEFDKE